MNNKKNRNISGLLGHAEKLKNDTEMHVNSVIDALQKKNAKINFRTISVASGVSTTTLYNNKSIRTRIECLRKNEKAKMLKEHSVEELATEQKMREEIKKLREEKEMLIIQLVKMDELQQENERLKALLSIRKIE